MKWQEIRNHYPQQWLLLEAIKAYSEAGKRILEQLSVVSAYPDSVAAMKGYTQLHRESPERELYVFHTNRETLDVAERRWLGIRGAQ
ncbi:MAG: hypothetical protein AAB658_04290 [Chloroflexota bacterium]